MVSNLLGVGVDLFESRVILNLPLNCIKSVITSGVESYQVCCQVVSSLVLSHITPAVESYQVCRHLISSLLLTKREIDVTN